ncbi:MAG: hypothetical protein H0X25_18080 [Acidobacteriales bacterium]|nr:hypothetical protein [Terriglobales bacterium]
MPDAGTYNVKVSAASFLPALRESVAVRQGQSASLVFRLNTLLESVQAVLAHSVTETDDWKWVLRSSVNRPILRMLPDGTLKAETVGDKSDLKGTLSFLAGSTSEGYGGNSDMSTGFAVEHSLFSAGTLALRGNLGYGSSSPNAVLRASYTHKLANGSEPQVAFTLRRLSSPDANLRDADLQALNLTTSDQIRIGNVLEVRFGSQMESIQFMGRVGTVRPFGTADLHLSPNTVVEYQYTTSEPDTRAEKGFDSAPADLTESGPRLSLAGFRPEIERARHQEVSLARRQGNNRFQVAAFSDQITDPALTGIGEVTSAGGNLLPDIYSNSFTYRGHDLDTTGVRVVYERTLTSNLKATVDYSYGGVLDFAESHVSLSDAAAQMTVQDRHALAAKFSGTLPKGKTKWIASYRWTSGGALTPVDQFNSSPGQSEPFLSLFLRQPIPGTGFLPGHMEALVDIRNLLAQGYVPVMGEDGETVYLVQAARSVRGGVAFTF